VVSTAFPEATRAGVEILAAGGNAIDAACAAALALSVCEPQASGLGGQSMALLHLGGKTIALDGSSRLPSLAHIERMEKSDRKTGYQAATVPSTVAVLGHLSFYYGKLPWAAVIEPAIRIAREGYRITALQSHLQKRDLHMFADVPDRSGAHYFLDDGKPYEPGALFVQNDLADLLTHLRDEGPKAFYTGRVAATIDSQMRAHGGFLRAEDMAWIPWPVERKPIARRYRDLRVVTTPPPGAGRTLLLTLMILGQFPSKLLRREDPEIYHLMAESYRKSFINRKERPFDPNTYPQIQDKLTRRFARELATSIRADIDPSLPMVELPGEGDDTTHLSVMDRMGNAIGITQSIERVYGSKAAAEGLGFLYNNYMMALDYDDPSHPYYLRPNGIPWSTVAPSIIFHHGRPWMVLGSPGSERIFSTIGQFIVNMVDRGMSMDQALVRPRFHCSVGGRISLEAERFDPAVIEYLASMGYKIDRREAYAFYLGAIHAVMRRQTGDGFQGVAEIRRDGTAAGPD